MNIKLLFCLLTFLLSQLYISAGKPELLNNSSSEKNGWMLPSNAKISSERTHIGKSSLMMTVSSPSDCTHITKNIPVIECAKYKLTGWIYIDNIEKYPLHLKAKEGDASLLLQFSDKNGKWFMNGDTTAKIKETGKWIFVETREIPAPIGAGSANIYLEIRGKGKVFFDNISLVECERNVIKLIGPKDKAIFTETRPSFTWTSDEIAQKYELDISGEKIKVTGTAYRLERELSSGTYTWTVTPQGGKTSEKQSFTITPKQGDSAGPDISPFDQQIADRKSIKITVSDKSGIDPDKTELIIDDKKIACSAVLKDNLLLANAASAFKRGAYRVSVKIFDKAGNATTSSAWVVCAPPPPVKMEWTSRGIKAGDRYIFPNIIYSVEPDNMAKVAKGGFNTVHTYRFENGDGKSILKLKEQTIEKAREYLDNAWENNLYVIMGFPRSGLLKYDTEMLASRIAALRNHPALLCWYLFDEPDSVVTGQYITPEKLSDLYELIKKLDPFHPVVVTFTSFASLTAYDRKCFDIHWTQNYDESVFPSKYIKWKEALGSRLSMLIINSIKITDAETHHFQAAVALALKSPGLAWWCYPFTKNRNYNDEKWNAFSKVSHELNKMAEYFITLEGKDLDFNLDINKDKMLARVRQTEKGVAVIFANISNEQLHFKLEIPGIKTYEETLEPKKAKYDIIVSK